MFSSNKAIINNEVMFCPDYEVMIITYVVAGGLFPNANLRANSSVNFHDYSIRRNSIQNMHDVLRGS